MSAVEIREYQSSNENVKKIVFTKVDAVYEAVLYKYPTYEERTVLCVSVQSGCAGGLYGVVGKDTILLTNAVPTVDVAIVKVREYHLMRDFVKLEWK